MAAFEARGSAATGPVSRERGAALVLLAVGAGLLAWNLLANRFFFHDDAFISLTYARNLAELGDLSWNPGDRVEGYTNFLHLVSASGLMRLGMDGVDAVRLLGALGAAGLAAAVAWGVGALAHGRALPRAAAVAATLGSVPVAVWVLGGLETVPAAALVAGGVAALMPCFRPEAPGLWRHATLSGALFALAYLTRPDSVIVNAAAGLSVAALGLAPLRRRIAQCIVVGSIPIAVIAAHVAWRLSYYGDAMPNTFHAKVGLELADRLAGVWRYVGEAGIVHLPVLSLGGAACLAVWALGRASRAMGCLLACVAAHTTYVAWSGGDHMPAARVMVTALGPGAMLLGAALAAAPARLRLPAAGGALAVVAAVALSTGGLRMNPAAYVGLIVGRHVEEAWPAGSLVALNTAGSTPWAAPSHRYVDMLGLNERAIALREDVPMLTDRQTMPGHAKGDGTHVLSLRPDRIILGPAEGRAADDPWFLSDVEIVGHPEFARCYEARMDLLDYEVAPAARIGFVADPLPFTHYARTCGE